MPTDYYDDSPREDEGDYNTPPPEERDPGDTKTALIPESLCPGMSVGDEVTLKIVAVHEGEYEVVYKRKDEDEDGSEKSGPSMSRAMRGNAMDEMMS